MLTNEYSLIVLGYILAAYVICGIVKGSIGFGLPTVSISLLAFLIDVKIIIALILLPTLIANIYQLSIGGNFKKIIFETKFFLFCSTIFIYPGAFLLKIFDSQIIIFFIALILLINSIFFLADIKFKIPNFDKPVIQILIGSINGIIIGMTSIYTMPLVFLLQSLNYNKNTTIQFLGIAFFLYPLAQLFAFTNFDLISINIIKDSILITLPIFLGFLIGKKIRDLISEKLFQKMFYLMLLFMSCIILINLI